MVFPIINWFCPCFSDWYAHGHKKLQRKNVLCLKKISCAVLYEKRRRYLNIIFQPRRLKYCQSKHYKNIILLFPCAQIRNKVGQHWLPWLNLTIINVFQKTLKRMNDSLSNFSWIWRLLAWRGGLRCDTIKKAENKVKKIEILSWAQIWFKID